MTTRVNTYSVPKPILVERKGDILAGLHNGLILVVPFWLLVFGVVIYMVVR